MVIEFVEINIRFGFSDLEIGWILTLGTSVEPVGAGAIFSKCCSVNKKFSL